jgi:hypothetical protein
MTPRDHQAEQDHAEWLGWAEANGYGNEHERDFGHDDMRDAFQAGMQGARDLAAAGTGGDGTLRTRITRLAETWESHPELTEEGQLLRELGEILRDELHHASDREAQPAAESPGLRAALVDAMLRWSGRDALDQCSSELAQILDQHPEPKPAPDLAAENVKLRGQIEAVKAIAEFDAPERGREQFASPKALLARAILDQLDPPGK